MRVEAWLDPEGEAIAFFVALAPAFGPGFGEPSCMLLYCIQKRLQNQQVVWLSFTMTKLG